MSNDQFIPSLRNESDDLIGMAITHAKSMACQGVIDVKKPTGSVCPVSINMLIVAEPGQRKSSVDSIVVKAITKEDV